MKQSKSFLTRCLALALALVLLASSANLGVALKVFAAESDKTVTVAELVADNYELTDAEKALLKSGNMVGGTYEYNVPADDDDLVTVDTEAKKITAQIFDEVWVPTAAAIYVGDEKKEDVTLHDCVGTYKYDENAFSVKVTYSLTHEVMLGTQETLLNAAANLKTAVTEIKAVYDGTDANLGTVVLAMPTLQRMAIGEDYVIHPSLPAKHLQLTEAAIAAVEALDAQLGEGDDKLDLQDLNSAYAASASKVQYLVENGAAYLSAVKAAYEHLSVIAADPLLTNINVDDFLAINDPAQATQWAAFKSILNNVVDTLAVVSASWDTSAVAEGANYAKLDTLVADVEATSDYTLKSALNVATATVQKNLSMFNVAVTVIMNTVQENEVAEYDAMEPVIVTLGKGATAEQIVAAVAKAGIEAAAQAEWADVYSADHYETLTSALPEALTEDIEYTISYNPVNYTVTYGEGFDGAPAEEYPYGYVLTLAPHDDANKEYDYTVNGEAMVQGAKYTVVGATTVERKLGKAYTSYNLYNVIADNYGDDVMKEILKSGALTGNKTIRVRVPEAYEVDELINLFEGKMEAQGAYAADYAGLSWVPYSYAENNSDDKLFSDNTVSGLVEKLVNVKYRLNLTNYSAAAVQNILDNAAALVTEGQTQIATLNRLVGHYDAMGSLDKVKLGALNGVIDVTDLHEDAAKNAALKAEFKTIVSGIINNNLEESNLRIYAMLTKYQDEATGGLTYYYANAQAVIDEISALSDYLNGMVDSDEKMAALEILTVAAGYPEYKDKIAELGRVMAEVKRDLTAPNALINLKSENLAKLITVLEAGVEAKTVGTVASPYLTSPTLTAVDASLVSVQVIVTVGDEKETFSVGPFDRGYVFTEAEATGLLGKAVAFAENTLGNKMAYYNVSGDEDLKALAGEKLTKRVETIEISYSPINYTINVAGKNVSVNIEKANFTLPGHEKEGYRYDYTVFGKTYKVYAEDVTVTLTAAELAQIVDGVYTVVRKEVYQAAEDLENILGGGSKPTEPEEPTEPADPDAPTEPVDPDAPTEPKPEKPEEPAEPEIPVMELVYTNGQITGITANVDPNMGGVMAFVNKLITIASHIELNDEALVELAGEGENIKTLVSVQTLMNAMLNDNNFGSETLIKLAQNNGGTLFTAKMNLGTSADNLKFTNLDFTFNLNSVPEQMVTVGNGLNAVKNYMYFKANDGVMDVKLNLPEKVYEIYLTAMLATRDLEITDINAINNEIAIRFLYDYIEVIINSDATAQSFQNTLDMLDAASGDRLPEADLVAYSAYYNALKKALVTDGIDVEFHGEKPATIGINASGYAAINGLLGLVSLEPGDMTVELAMVKEYQTDANGKPLYDFNVGLTAELVNASTEFEAAVLDLDTLKEGTVEIKNQTATKGDLVDMTQGLDMTSDLAKRLSEITGPAVIMLLDDIDGDLVVNHGTILDLNGKTINGNVVANGTLYIFDSTMDTFKCGGVTGTVSGNARIVAGNYKQDVTAFLKDGYYQTESGAVANAVYTIETDGVDMVITLDSDYMYSESVEGYLPSVTAIAGDIAFDLATKYLAPAALSIDGYQIYNINFDKLIALLNSTEKIDDVIDMFAGCFSKEDLSGFVNSIIDTLTNWREMAKALRNDEVIGDWLLTTAPWSVVVEYVPETDHIDLGIAASNETEKLHNVNVGLRIVGTNKDTLMDLIMELHDIVSIDVNVDLKKPSWDGKNNILDVAGNADATVYVDLTASQTYTNLDYITVITVILANGNPGANSDAMVAALNEHDLGHVKEAFDQMTVEDVFDALKKLNKTDDFKKLAANVGVELDVNSADKLENLYHLIMAATGKVLERLDITGLDKKMGGLDKDNDGIYELGAAYNRDGDVSVRGYTVDFDIENVSVLLKVNIFGCLLGDVNHDGKVNAKDGTLILRQTVNKVPEGAFFCEKGAEVNGDGKINAKDGTLILKYTVNKITEFPIEK